MQAELDPRPKAEVVEAWIARARLDEWLARKEGFVEVAKQARRFVDRLEALQRIRSRLG